MSNEMNWNADSDRKLLLNLIGQRYGPNPENHVDKIRADKAAEAIEVARRLELDSGDTIADLGTGCGWIAEPLAPTVKKLICLDISDSYVEYSKRELGALGNVEVRRIDFGDLEYLIENAVTKIFASNVFTQFSYYDIAIYLREVARALPSGGLFYFNYNEMEQLDLGKNEKFHRHCENYRKNRADFSRLLQWHSAASIEKCARHFGFEIRGHGPVSECGPWFLLAKT